MKDFKPILKNLLPCPAKRIQWLMLSFAFFLFFSYPAFVAAQSNGDYQTNGNVTFASATNWQIYSGGWIAAATAPDYNNGVITIRSGHTATLSTSETLDQVIVQNGAVLNVNSFRTLTLNDGPGTDLRVFGILNNSGTINLAAGAFLQFTSTGVYNHTRNGGSIPSANWHSASDCNITGVSNSMPSGLNQSFGNFTWNCPGHTGNLYMQSDMTVQGNMTVSNTGPVFDPNTRALRMSNNSTGYTITVLGDFI
ncbi:MAG: hypothetical protein V2I37_13070, partial [Marinilabiliaceae bacterium]|nr:hypothetical protein [Marinilabiliaceae bacterium]